jgi:hypothetical protein
MQGNVLAYWQATRAGLPPEIVGEASSRRIDRTAAAFRHFSASEYILESRLGCDQAETDFSLRVLAREEGPALLAGLQSPDFASLSADPAWEKVLDFVSRWPREMADVWLEMDDDEMAGPLPRPCFFFSAAAIKDGGKVNRELLRAALSPLLEEQQLDSLWGNLNTVIGQLPPEVGVFQIGVMLARQQNRVRIFTRELSREQADAYLDAIRWPGPWHSLQELWRIVQPYSDGRYILDFDISQPGISEKLGINFGLDQKRNLADFTAHLTEKGLCTATKAAGVQAWSGSQGKFLGPDYGFTALLKNISHFKLTCDGEAGLQAKAYLGIMGIYLAKLWRAGIQHTSS